MAATATIASLQRTIDAELKAIGIEEGERRAETELIMSCLTGLSLAERMRDATREMPQAAIERMNEIIERRKKREPIQYCLGETHFFGMRFHVRPGVLIPRSDTETIVQAASDYITDRGGSKQIRIGEIGIGSGIISIALLKMFPAAIVAACDISAEALAASRQNAELHGVAARLEIVESDWHDWITSQAHKFDVLVSNPPYIPPCQEESLAPEVRIWEPSIALYGYGNDGLGFYRDFACLAPVALHGDARVFLEIGYGQSDSVCNIFDVHNWYLSAIYPDLNGIARVLSFALKNAPFEDP